MAQSSFHPALVFPRKTSDSARLSLAAAFYLQASMIVFFPAGSSAPTAMYALYQSAWGFSPITVTVIFGIYALAVLCALLVVGSLSDHVGRRPVLFVAALLQAVTMAVFARADGLGELLAARVLQGVATGAAVGAVGAGMLDIDREKGTIANAVGPLVGVALGALLSGLFVRYLPAPTTLLYEVLGVIFVAQSIGVLFMPETGTRTPGAIASLRPRLNLPTELRRPFLLAVPALMGTWSLAGFYGSLGPSLVRKLVHETSPALAGLALFVLAASGATAVFLTRARSAREMMLGGPAALAFGVWMAVLAIGHGTVVWFFVGTAVSGAGFGATFQGAIRSVILLAAPQARAGVLSMLYVVAYLSMGLPVVIGGARVVQTRDVLGTACEYGSVVIVLALVALFGTLLLHAKGRRVRSTSRA